MGKQNKSIFIKCKYCKNEATGIIYRPKDQLQNVFSCYQHATNLFIAFQGTKYNQKLINQSRYRSPMKKSQLNVSAFSQINNQQKNPELFFDRLMQNIIAEFNSMKKQILSNFHSMKNIQKNQQALKYKMEGDYAYPYMLINNDEDMMMGTFLNRLLGRYNNQIEKLKRQQIIKRRIQLSTLISNQNVLNLNLQKEKQTHSILLSRSVQGSPDNYKRSNIVEKSLLSTQRKTAFTRDYSRTQKREPKRQNQKPFQ